MRIVIDATSLLLRSAGVKNYMHYWLSSLMEARCNHGDRIGIYPPGLRLRAKLDHEQVPRPALLRMVQFCNIRANPTMNFLLAGADVVHASQHMANRPLSGKLTATIFDLSCWITPENHTPENIAATRRHAERILKRCDGLIAISSHTRQDAVEILGIPQERIRVVYPGVAEAFFDAGPEETEAARSQYALPVSYMLFVGCIEPRKNVPNLVRAHRQLPDELQRDAPLVIAGPFGWANEEVRKMFSSPEVRYLGYVPEAYLPGLMRGATALIYPSYYEGFGFPPAQAMAAGVPVIASDRSCLPEVVGDAGLLVNPDDVEGIASAMEKILMCPEIARDLAARGKARANAFRWSTCANQSLKFFHEVGGR